MAEVKKADLKSMDIPEDKMRQLKQAFPEAFTEGLKVDLDKLKLALGENVEIGKERFGMNWPGKADCFKIIQAPSVATLVPARDESVSFDTTENLFIEGDNLEVLKLLQKSYYGKIKMIYIDPPYNTGKEFIYPDNYAESLDTYLRYSGQIDAEGRKYSTNSETDGRFHSKWMNMMYPRLYSARNLLRNDGVIFISIDDNEVSNLRKICDEIYGEENFIALLPWKGRGGGADNKILLENHEYVLAYAKTKELFASGRKIKTGEKFPHIDKEKNRNYKTQLARKWGSNSRREDRRNLYYSVKTYDGIEFFPKLPDGSDGRWRWSRDRMMKAIENHDVEFNLRDDNNWEAYEKIYEPGEGEYRTTLYGAWLQDEIYEELEELLSGEEPRNTAYGTKELKSLFDNTSYFDFPKPTPLIKILANIASAKDTDIIFDFFSGSCTTAHALMDLNKQDNGNRKFICVQLPEICAEDSEALRAGYKTIADIGKERIRRVIKKIEEEQTQIGNKEKLLFHENKTLSPQDLGFKVFKLAQSNFKVWDGNSEPKKEAVEKQLEMHVDHINPKSSQEDILFELLLKAGFELTTKIEKVSMVGKTVYLIEGGLMLICLEKELTKEVIKAMAEKCPSRVICLDEGFAGNDQLKTNAVQTMKSKGIEDFRTV